MQIINTDNIETKENKQFDNSKPSVNFISFEFKKFIDGYRNMSTGSNSNSDINIIPIESSVFYKKQYSDYFNDLEQKRQLEKSQQSEQIRQKEIEELRSLISILKSDIDSLKTQTQNISEKQIQIQNKYIELQILESQLQMLQSQPQNSQPQNSQPQNSENNSNIIFLDKNIKNNNKPFMNIILLLSRDNERKIPDNLSTIFIYVSNGFSFPNLNIIGDRKKFYKIGHIFTVVPYIDSNNQLLYKPLTQLIESCPTCPTCQTCPTCPNCETCPTCPAIEICPVLDKRPYIIGLAICGALIIILICILFYTKSKQ